MNNHFKARIALGTILICSLIFTACGRGNKVKLEWDTVAEKSTKLEPFQLNVYVENSGSMDGYMLESSNLKDAVFDYVSDLKQSATTCYLAYINSQVIPYSGTLEGFIRDLNPQSFAMAGGNRANTDLMLIIQNILKRRKKNAISIFISDCILDLSGNTTNYLGRCQVSIKNSFNEALKADPNLGVEILKMESQFDGWWFCGGNKELLQNVKRPYYIWIIGNQQQLAALNKKYPITDIIGGIKGYSAYASPQPLPFDFEKSTYVVGHSDKIELQAMVNLNGSLQDDEVIKNTENYKLSNTDQMKITSIEPISDKDNKYSHVINLEIDNPQTLRTASISFVYPTLAPWVSATNDETGQNIKKNLDKTTGIRALIQGVADAYKDANTYGTISFNIKNK